MRKSRKSASNGSGEGGGRLLLHLGPGLRQVIESDEVYFVEAKGDDTEVRTRAARVLKELTLGPPVNVVLPVSRSALAALWAAFGEE